MANTTSEINAVVRIIATRIETDPEGYTFEDAARENAKGGWYYHEATGVGNRSTILQYADALSPEDLREAYRRASLPPNKRGRPIRPAADRRQLRQVFLLPGTIKALEARAEPYEGLGPVIDRIVASSGR